MASITIEDGCVTDVTVHPINIGLDEKTKEVSFPTLATDDEITDYLAKLSAPFGTKFNGRKIIL